MSHNAEKLVVDILLQIAKEKRKSFTRVKRLLLIDGNRGIHHQFWEILNNKLPDHTFEYVGCCPDCGSLELC
jgi:hypothetical protein